jgi:alpha-beta hydrolase superfamily lysophospholipase
VNRAEATIDGIQTYHFEGHDSKYALLIVHGMGGHGGIYDDFCEEHAPKGADLWTFDLPGHGHSLGPRGDWRIEDAIDAMHRVAQEIDTRTGLPIFVLASSMGSSVTLYGLNESPLLRGAALMGAAIPYFSPLREANAYLRTQPIQQLVAAFGNSLRLDLDRYLDFERTYGDPKIAAKKKLDPLNTWTYGFEDYVHFLTYEPKTAPADNTKPIFVLVGENDPLFPPENTKQVVDAIGGPTRFHVVPNGAHQLMLFHTDEFSRLVHDWIIELLADEETD